MGAYETRSAKSRRRSVDASTRAGGGGGNRRGGLEPRQSSPAAANALLATFQRPSQQAFWRLCTPRRAVLLAALLTSAIVLLVVGFVVLGLSLPTLTSDLSVSLLAKNAFASRVHETWTGLVRLGSRLANDAEQGGEFGAPQARLSSSTTPVQAGDSDGGVDDKTTSEWVRGVEPMSSSTGASKWARGTDGDRVALADGSSFVYRNQLCVFRLAHLPRSPLRV